MTTITDLSQILNPWIRRLRLQRTLTWALRGLIIGLALALVAGWIGLSQARLLRNEFLTLVASFSLVAALVFALTAFLWPLRPLQAARYFDLVLHLDERLSTALELAQGSIRVPAEMVQRQFQDTLSASQRVNLRRELPLQYRVWEGALALLLAAVIGVVWFRGENWFEAAQRSRAVERAVTAEAAQIQEIVKQVQANEQLSESQKQALTAPLQEAQRSLQENPSLENSVSVLTSTGEKLQALSDPQSQQMSQTLQEAGDQLARQEGSPLQSIGQDLAQGDNVNAASKMKNLDVNKLSPAEQQQLADQLDRLASSLQSTNPQLANELRQAADALRSGDTGRAQQALSSAAKSLAQAGQQVIFSQTANQTASQLQQGTGQVLAAGGGQADQTAQSPQSGKGANQGQQTNGSGGSGSGRGTDSGSDQTGPEAGSAPITQDNGPGNGGETSYEPIYAPTLLGGEGGSQVNLPPSGEDNGEVTGQGPATPGDPGTSLVPYSEVYSHYEQISNRAIENNEVPPQFMQIIRNYFDSLKP